MHIKILDLSTYYFDDSNLGNFIPFYWYGDTFNNFSTEFNIVATHGRDVSITARSTDIYISTNGANDGKNQKAFIQFNSMIDVTNLKQLVVLGYNETNATAYTSLLYAGISKTSELIDFSSMEKYASNDTTKGNAILIIDTSDLNGKYNLYAGLECTYAGSSYYGHGNLFSIFGVPK